MVEDRYTACAEQLAVTPQLVRQMLHDHSPAADGNCHAHGCHYEAHPCSMRRLAELARTRVLAGRVI